MRLPLWIKSIGRLRRATLAPVLREVAAEQEGIVTRRQALAAGMTVGAVRSRIEAGQWQRIHAGTYATFSGPIPWAARLWGAVLACGSGALLSHHTAAQLAGLVKSHESPLIHVTVPTARRVAKMDGVRLHLSSGVRLAAHPALSPPRTRIEVTVIDLVASTANVEQAMSLISCAVGSGLTTAHRLTDEIASRAKVRFRRELNAALADVVDGTHSVLEWRYLRDVERRHRLPKGVRQKRFHRTRQDVAYDDFWTVVELDGLQGHRDARLRDMRRDNFAAAHGLTTLRYGWTDVAGAPCAVAAQVASVLRLRGWTGTPRRCGPHCVIT